VRHDDDMRNLIDQTVKRFGRLDVAVNNALLDAFGRAMTKSGKSPAVPLKTSCRAISFKGSVPVRRTRSE